MKMSKKTSDFFEYSSDLEFSAHEVRSLRTKVDAEMAESCTRDARSSRLGVNTHITNRPKMKTSKKTSDFFEQFRYVRSGIHVKSARVGADVEKHTRNTWRGATQYPPIRSVQK